MYRVMHEPDLFMPLDKQKKKKKHVQEIGKKNTVHEFNHV